MPTLNGRELSFYASLLGEVVTWIAQAIAILVLTIVLNPQLAHAGPVEDRWPNEIAAPSALEAASFLNVWDLVKSGADIVAHDDPPGPPLARIDATIRCAHTPDKSTSHWMWREVDRRQCWYVGTTLVPKSRLRWPISDQVD